jgi:PmbA protein
METDNQTLLSQLLDAARTAGADGADAMLARGQSTSVTIRLGKVEASERSEEFDIGLRVFVGQRTASVSTSQLDPATINELATRAVAMARLAPEDPFVRLARADEIAKSIPDLDMFDPAVPDAARLQDRAAAAETAALSHGGIKTVDHADAGHGVVDVLIGTSNGFMAGYKRSSHGVSAVVIAERDGHMERDYDYSAAVYESDLEPAEEVGRKAAERTLERLGACKPRTGRFPVIYDRRVAASLVGTMAGAINGAAIARGTSFLKDSLGKQATRAGLNFIDDPLRPRGMGSRLFDAEGLPVSKRRMIDDGVLTGWFLDLAAAAKLKMAPTGNARRGVGSPPGPGTSNFFIENGTLSRADLIADIDEGFLVTEMIGSTVDMITGDYSRGAGGFWISKGKISHPISEATIAGNLKDMFMQITAANDIDLRDSMAAPSLRVDSMMVAGS